MAEAPEEKPERYKNKRDLIVPFIHSSSRHAELHIMPEEKTKREDHIDGGGTADAARSDGG